MVDRFSKIILSLSLCSGTLLASDFAAETPDHEMKVISASQTDNGVAVSEAKESLDLRKEEKAADKLAVLKKDPLAIEQGDPKLESETAAESNAEPGLIAEIEAVAESTVESVFESDHFAALTESSRRIVRDQFGRPFSAVFAHKVKNVTSNVKEQTTQPEPEIQPADHAALMDEDEALFDPATIPGISTLDLNEFDDTYPVDEALETALFEGNSWQNESGFIDDYELIGDENGESEVLEDSTPSDETASDQDEEVWEEEVIEDPEHEYFEITIKGKNPQAVMQHLFKLYGDPQDFDEAEIALTDRIRDYYESPQRIFANWSPFQNYWGQTFGYPKAVYPKNLALTRNLPWYMRTFF